MKKALSLVLTFVLIFELSAYGNTTNTSESIETKENTIEKAYKEGKAKSIRKYLSPDAGQTQGY